MATPQPSSPELHHIRAAFDPAAAKAGSVAVPRTGRVYFCGATAHGACGVDNKSAPLHIPQLLTTLLEEQVEQVSCGWRHTAIVSTEGNAYSCGDGEHGKLGHGDDLPRATPERIGGLLDVKVVLASCGHSHTAFACGEGNLYTCGLGLYGQLGHGSLKSEPKPRLVQGLGGPCSVVACGDSHTLVLRSDGRALSCGFNESGRLGRTLDDGAQCAERFGTMPLHSALAAASEAFYVVALDAGGAHTAIVYADGSVYTCGRGDIGQLGHGLARSEVTPRRVQALKTVRVRRVAAGASHTLFLTSEGKVFACGSGGMGRLGVGHRETVLAPVPVERAESHVVIQISAGGAHSALVTDRGEALTFGDDGDGQCGVNAQRRSALLPSVPHKFGAAGVSVLGASCGGTHTAFLLRSIIDEQRDLREDQIKLAAATIEKFFRGKYIRRLQEAARKAAGRSVTAFAQSRANKENAARHIQAAWRYRLSGVEAEQRAAQALAVRTTAVLHEGAAATGGAGGWGLLRRQFAAAKMTKSFTSAAIPMSKSSW